MEWLRAHQELLWWMGAFSIATLVVSALVCPILIARLPADHFVREERPPGSRSPARRLAALARNLLGWLLVAAGVAMLLLPGQGILTILIGLTLIGFPGKRRVERRLARIPLVRRTLGWIRRRAGRPPLRFTPAARPDPPRDRDPR